MRTISTQSLSKKYRQFQALNNVHLSVNEGEIYGFIGLNGAGKTTMMRLLLNMIKPTTGSATILGKNVANVSADFWNNVGYLIETPHGYANLTVNENLEMYGKMRRIPKKIRQSRIAELMDQIDLTTYKNKAVKELSLGNKQKIGLIKALMHQPKVLLLDEPTNGLDPQGLTQVKHLLLHLAKDEGTTILISSHILNEMEKIFTSFGILNDGILVEQKNRQEYLKVAQHQVQLTFANPKDLQLAECAFREKAISWQTTTVPNQIYLTNVENISEKMGVLLSRHIVPRDWHEETQSLESYFLAVLQREEHENVTTTNN